MKGKKNLLYGITLKFHEVKKNVEKFSERDLNICAKQFINYNE